MEPKAQVAFDESGAAVARIDVASVSSLLASRLCSAILEHTLYLNGQLPFPVQSLGRLKLEGKAHAKAAKKRTELLESLDLLTTHLPSTFQSLSWALAENPGLKSQTTTSAHVILVTGPTPSTAKSRCIIQFESFHVEAFGHRQDPPQSMAKREDFVNVAPDNDIEEEDANTGDLSFTSNVSDVSEALSLLSVSSTTTHNSATTEGDTEGEESKSDSEDEDGDEGEDSDGDVEDSDGSSEEEPAPHTNPSFVSVTSTAETEQTIRSAVRTLGLAMASACEFDRDGLPVTQTHIMLRAPRRFTHPSWLPKPLLKKPLDDRLFKFFDPTTQPMSSGRPSIGSKPPQSLRRGCFEEGIRVVANAANGLREGLREMQMREQSYMESGFDEEGSDEMIWWQWNASPIRGFGDI